MKHLHNVATGIFLGSLLFGSVYPDKSTEYEKAAQEGILAIRNIAKERDVYKVRLNALEKIKKELENLLAIQIGEEDINVIDKISALKEELEELFMLDDEAKEDSIGAVIEKLAALKKELKELFPSQGDEEGGDVIEMIQKLTELKQELQVLLPNVEPAGEGAPQPICVNDVVDKLSALKKDLLKLFPEDGDKDLMTRIQSRIDGYEKELSTRDGDLRKVRKDLRKFKKELKEAAKALRAVVDFAERVENSKD